MSWSECLLSWDPLVGTFLVPLWLALAFFRWLRNICLKLSYLFSRQHKGYRRHCLLLMWTCTNEHLPRAVSFVEVYDEFCQWDQSAVSFFARFGCQSLEARSGLDGIWPSSKNSKPGLLAWANWIYCVISKGQHSVLSSYKFYIPLKKWKTF